MKLTIRGFKKETLAKYTNIIEQPLVALGKNTQETLGINPGPVKINNVSARIIEGSSEDFIALTKTLRQKLGVERGEEAEVICKEKALILKKN